MQQALGFVLRHAALHRNEAFLRHQLGNRLTEVGREPHIAVGENTDEPALASLAPILDDRNSRDRVRRHQLQGLVERRCRTDGDGIEDDSRFVLLHGGGVARLLFRSEVAVQHPDAAFLCHGNGEAALGHGIHGR